MAGLNPAFAVLFLRRRTFRIKAALYGPALRKSLSRRPGRAAADRTGKRGFQRILSAGGMCGWLVAVGDVGFSHTGCRS